MKKMCAGRLLVAVATGTFFIILLDALALEKVVVVPLGGTVGNATAADVLEGKTFSSKVTPGFSMGFRLVLPSDQ